MASEYPLSYNQRMALAEMDRGGLHDASLARSHAWVATVTVQTPDSAKSVLRALHQRGLADREFREGVWYWWLTDRGLELARKLAAAG